MKKELKVGDLAKVKDYSEYYGDLKVRLSATNGVVAITHNGASDCGRLGVEIEGSEVFFWPHRSGLKRIKPKKEKPIVVGCWVEVVGGGLGEGKKGIVTKNDEEKLLPFWVKLEGYEGILCLALKDIKRIKAPKEYR